MNQKPISRLDINIQIFKFVEKKGINGLSVEEAEAINKLRSAQVGKTDFGPASAEELESLAVISKE